VLWKTLATFRRPPEITPAAELHDVTRRLWSARR
jgi:hypothetical protein